MRSRFVLQNTIRDLQRVKADLQNAKEDYDGHRDTAIAACDKALEELQAVMKAMPAFRMPRQPQTPPGAPTNAPQPAPTLPGQQ
jgi:hypothetical protein